MPEPLTCTDRNSTNASTASTPDEALMSMPPRASTEASPQQSQVQVDADASPHRSAGSDRLTSSGNGPTLQFVAAADEQEASVPHDADSEQEVDTPPAPRVQRGNTNAERVASVPDKWGTVDAGVNENGDSVYVEGGLIRGDRGRGPAEIVSVSVQVGAHTQASVAVGRMEVQGNEGATQTTIEAATVDAHVGRYNADGSEGLTVGVTTIVGAALTHHQYEGGNSVSIGGGVGLGAAGSVGTRDADGDGEPEVCAQLSVGFVAGGACVEPGPVVDAVVEWWNEP